MIPFSEGPGTTPLLAPLSLIAAAIDPEDATNDELGLMLPMGLLPLLDALRSLSMIPLPGIRTADRPLDSRTMGGVVSIEGGGEAGVGEVGGGRTSGADAGAREKSDTGAGDGNVECVRPPASLRELPVGAAGLSDVGVGAESSGMGPRLDADTVERSDVDDARSAV